MDKFSANLRSENMRRIRSSGTRPEMLVRRLALGMGYRFRLHRKDLPSKPDLVFASRRKVIFVHGCFWHQHPGCREGPAPSSNEGYWKPKLARNVERDASALAALTGAGWEVLVMWECETKDRASLQKRLCDFLS